MGKIQALGRDSEEIWDFKRLGTVKTVATAEEGV
jgi:hypothetical protein